MSNNLLVTLLALSLIFIILWVPYVLHKKPLPKPAYLTSPLEQVIEKISNIPMRDKHYSICVSERYVTAVLLDEVITSTQLGTLLESLNHPFELVLDGNGKTSIRIRRDELG